MAFTYCLHHVSSVLGEFSFISFHFCKLTVVQLTCQLGLNAFFLVRLLIFIPENESLMCLTNAQTC